MRGILGHLEFTVVQDYQTISATSLQRGTRHHILLVATLIITRSLMKFIPTHLSDRTRDVMLNSVILIITSMVARRSFAVNVRRLMRTYDTLISILIAVMRIRLHTITVPRTIAATQGSNPILTIVALIYLRFPVGNVMPREFSAQTIRPFTRTTKALRKLPTAFQDSAIMLLRSLRIDVGQGTTTFRYGGMAPTILLSLRHITITMFATRGRAMIIKARLICRNFRAPRATQGAIPMRQAPFLAHSGRGFPGIATRADRLIVK